MAGIPYGVLILLQSGGAVGVLDADIVERLDRNGEVAWLCREPPQSTAELICKARRRTRSGVGRDCAVGYSTRTRLRCVLLFFRFHGQANTSRMLCFHSRTGKLILVSDTVLPPSLLLFKSLAIELQGAAVFGYGAHDVVGGTGWDFRINFKGDIDFGAH